MIKIVQIILTRGGVIRTAADDVSVNPRGVSVLTQNKKGERLKRFIPNDRILDLTIERRF